jgi:hypothetical protein
MFVALNQAGEPAKDEMPDKHKRGLVPKNPARLK